MSSVLVFLQFLFIAVVAFPFERPALTFLNVGLFAAGLAVFFSALIAMKMRTFTVMPEPKPEGELVTRGIYRFVRHPMYLAVLLCTAGASLAYHAPWKWGVAGLLLFVLIVKMRREEKFLLDRYPGYAAYCSSVKRIIPFVF